MRQWQSGRTAVTGYGGQLGTEVCKQLGQLAIPLAESDLDLTDARAVRDCLTQLSPGAVVNAAAYTQVDRAEADAENCFRVNAAAVETLATVCRDLDCPLMQVSTDYVFGADSERRVPYTEDDEPGPVNVYGQSKLAGEQAARVWEKHFVVRTCGLYSPAVEGPVRGRNFVDTMLSLAGTQTTLKIVDDQRCTPSYVPHVAQAMIRLLDTEQFGTYHVTNLGSATWLEFAAHLFQLAGIEMSLVPITTAEYRAPAPRAAYTVLDTTRFQKLGATELPPWQDGLRDYLTAFRRIADRRVAR
jgi:dTDP-4-dehydrorhamnose reductase